MWLRSSRSSLLVLVSLAGCNLPTPKAVPSPKPTEAWVRLDSLMALQPVSRVPAAVQQQPVTKLIPEVRPPLLIEPLLTRTTGWDQAQQRRLSARAALEGADQAGFQEFGERLRRRQIRFLEISKAQFEVQERLVAMGKDQDDQEEAQRSVAEQVAALNDDLSLAQIQYQVSRALASPANDTLLAPDEPVKVAAEVERLKANKLRAELQVDSLGLRRAKVIWPGGAPPRNARVLYAAARDALKELCDSLEAQISQTEVLAEVKRQWRREERELEVRQRVAQRLEGIKSRDETFLLRLDQEEGLSRVLLAEELPTRRAAEQAVIASMPSSQQVKTNHQNIPLLVRSKESASSAQEAEIRAVVQDIARQRGIRLYFAPRPGVPDRTAEFAQWIKVRL